MPGRAHALALLCTLLLAALAVPPFAGASGVFREEFTRTFQKSLALASGQAVRIEHRQGSIVVRTQQKPEVVINASIRTSAGSKDEAASFGNQINIDVQQDASALSIRTVYPERRSGFFSAFRDVSYSVDYDILMPESAPLQIKNSFGNVTVSNLKANADINNSHGLLTFRGGQGSQRLENSFGGIQVEGNSGNVSITNSNQFVSVTQVDGSLTLRNRFGNVTVSRIAEAALVKTSFGAVDLRDVGGHTDIQNSNGKILVEDLRGGAVLKTTFGAIEATGISGDATVSSTNAPVTLANVGGFTEIRNTFGKIDVSGLRKGVSIVAGNAGVTLAGVAGDSYVKTSFGLVKAERIGGSLMVESSNGGVRATSIQGSVNAKTSFAAVVLDGVGGSVDALNQNGSIEVSGIAVKPGGCKNITLKTSFAPIRVYLDEGAGFDVNARTSFGKIMSDLPVTSSGIVSGDTLMGKIGNGGCELNLTNSNGNVEILKSSKKPAASR